MDLNTPMDLKQIAKDTTKTLISYLTYRAVRIVYEQLDETEPKRAYWLNQFASRESIKDGEVFLQALFKERQELAFRILTVRESLADDIADFLPEMLQTTVRQFNIEQRKQQLERMTQVDLSVEEVIPIQEISPSSGHCESSEDAAP
ncbi:MAG: chaperonin family protein RbcX [Thermosynechococcaceae cyanobacterium]